MLEQFYRMLNAAASALQSPFLLLVRLYWGWQFIQTGWGKLHNIPKIVNFFTTLGIPMPGVTAHFIAGLEFIGGSQRANRANVRQTAFPQNSWGPGYI